MTKQQYYFTYEVHAMAGRALTIGDYNAYTYYTNLVKHGIMGNLHTIKYLMSKAKQQKLNVPITEFIEKWERESAVELQTSSQ
jgi:hypothetical protein